MTPDMVLRVSAEGKTIAKIIPYPSLRAIQLFFTDGTFVTITMGKNDYTVNEGKR